MNYYDIIFKDCILFILYIVSTHAEYIIHSFYILRSAPSPQKTSQLLTSYLEHDDDIVTKHKNSKHFLLFVIITDLQGPVRPAPNLR